MRVLLCFILSVHLVAAEFGCGADTYSGEWQHDPARGVLMAGFILIGMATLVKGLANYGDYAAMSTITGGSPYLHTLTACSVAGGALIIWGVTKLDGYDNRHTVGATLTVTWLITGIAALMLGMLLSSYTFSKNREYSRILSACGAFLISSCWIVWSVTLHYAQDSEFQLMSWFGMCAALMGVLPYVGHRRFISTATGELDVVMWISTIVTALGLAFLATVVQHGPCQR